MVVNIEQVENIAKLAKLSFTEEEKSKFVEQFNQILQYVEKLNELDMGQVEPTSHVLGLTNVTRDDLVQSWLTQEEALENAPKKQDGYFSVPKVIG
jgi:aspartyl-tRNA(Asn)/glutamyl-tRNA(Gln) amidotransferase subunit C